MSWLEIFNYRVTRKNYSEIIHDALHLGDYQSPFIISTLNVPMLKEARRKKSYEAALKESTIIIPDGIGLVWASRLLYGSEGLAQRVTGPDLFNLFCAEANRRKLRFFFLGSTEPVLALMVARLERDYKDLEIAGTHSPPFGQWSGGENNKIIEKINNSGTDVLWVGMTAPKQEMWIRQNKKDLHVKVIIGVGAAFDFFAGSRKRAPLWIQKLGMEWPHRVVKEPVRIGWRYATTIPFFLILTVKSWLVKAK